MDSGDFLVLIHIAGLWCSVFFSLAFIRDQIDRPISRLWCCAVPVAVYHDTVVWVVYSIVDRPLFVIAS
jgi:hypothetical protein